MKNLLLTLFVLLLTSAMARADLMYTFNQSNYNVAPGGTVNVQVFLTQTNPVTAPADLTIDGLASAGVLVDFSTVGPTDRAEVLNVSDIAFNPAFDDSLFEVTSLTPGVSAGLADSVNLNPLIGSSILLGTFTFTAGLVPGEVTNLIATDFSGLAETVAGNGEELDDFITNGMATITVTGGRRFPNRVVFS